MSARTQDELCLILGLSKCSFRGLYVDGQACVRSLDTEKYAERNDYEIVLILPQDTPDLFHHADHHQLVVADTKRFADRIFAKIQLLHERVSDEADIHLAFSFGRREVTAIVDGSSVDVHHVGGLSIKVDVLGFAVEVARLNASRGGSACSHFFAGSALFGDCLHIVEFNLPILKCLNDDVEVGYSERSARDLKNICPEVGDLLLDVHVRALHNRHDGDQRRYPHGEAEHRERCSQLVLP